MSEMLEKARKYEDEQGKQIKAEDRPAFHVSPYVGWMNDPNGFSYYQGEYHLFYQYNPYDTHWDSMHWGHVVSKDLLHWEYLPAALAPDEDYDKMGCFSGSAIELDDGRQLLMYTAVDHETLEDGSKRDIQTQAVAVGDGRDYVKYEKNPVLTEYGELDKIDTALHERQAVGHISERRWLICLLRSHYISSDMRSRFV